MKDTLRIFLAVRPPEEVIEKLYRTISLYKKELWGKDVRWVKPENLHLTLKFIGQLEKDRIDNLYCALEAALKDYPSFTVDCYGLKLFPKPAKPNVISVGISKQSDLNNLVSVIENVLERHDIQKEKRTFQGHITLGRCKRSFPKRQNIENLCETLSFLVDELIVYSSILKPDGPEYSVVKKIRFV